MMKTNLYATLVASSVALLLASCATQISSDAKAPTGAPSATLTIEEVQASYYGSVASGTGVLEYQGKKHPFTVTGLGAGGTGAQQVSATGKIYGLDRLADFPGTYTGVRSGLTLIQGTMHEKLTNANGTVIYLTGHTTGLASTSGADEIVISLK